MLRTLLTPRWLARHLLLVVLVVATALLGRWQLGRALSAHGTIQNYGYAVEWWVFAGVCVFGWSRLVVDERRSRAGVTGSGVAPTPAAGTAAAATDGGLPAYRPVTVVGTVGGDAGTGVLADGVDEVDEELAAYNRHLAWLAAHPRG